MECTHCKKEFKNAGGMAAHMRSCKDNPDRKPWNRQAWNKGLVGVQIPWNKGKRGVQEAWNKGLTGLQGTPHSEETKKKLSEVAKANGLGGYVKGSGRGKKGWYKGFFCDSSWELAYLVYHLDHGIPVKRNNEKFEYEFEGKKKNYIPDFLLEDRFVEIKGYQTKQWQAKKEQFPHKLEVLAAKEIQPYLDYAVAKYGKDFTKLYGEVAESGLLR